MPSLGERTPPIQSRYMLPVCKDPILPPPTPKPPDRHTDTITPTYQPSKVADEPLDVDVIEPDLNTDFGENVPQQKGIIHKVYKRPGKKYLRDHQNCTHRVTVRI